MDNRQSFSLEISLNITAVDEHGRRDHGNSLGIRDSLTITADTFMEVAAVLGRFHELAQVLKREHEYPPGGGAEAARRIVSELTA